MYTSHGLMDAADLADHHAQHDTGPNPYCNGHDEADAWGYYDGTTYCTAAQNCPHEESE